MNMFRHHHIADDHIADDHEAVTLADLVQNSQERIPLPRAAQQGSATETGTRDKVQGMSPVEALKARRHNYPIISAASLPPLQKTQGRGTQGSVLGRKINNHERACHPPADNTAGGTAEGRAVQVMGELGGAGQSFQPNAQTDSQADAIIQNGTQQLGQDQQQQIDQAVQHKGCSFSDGEQHCN